MPRYKSHTHEEFVEKFKPSVWNLSEREKQIVRNLENKTAGA